MTCFFISLCLVILNFYKYQGAGNDFIFIDNREGVFPKQNTDLIKELCDRHFGIGADGLILIENHRTTDFEMVYFNADSGQTMCGNGARCAVAFAKKLGIIENSTNFSAYDGPHEAHINDDQTISLGMVNVDTVEVHEDHVFTNTGTVHHVELVDSLNDYPVVSKGRKKRYDIYGESGSNINFVEQKNENTFRIRTYEKGVEDETLACGTGVTAAAIAMHKIGKTKETSINLNAEGGDLNVRFEVIDDTYQNVILTGPAKFIYQGSIEVSA